MPDSDTIESWRELLAAQRRTLAVYVRQLANLGADYAPPGVHNGAAEARAAIARLKADLRAAGATVADDPSDDAPPPSEASAPSAGGRRHTLSISGYAQVGVAIAGDNYGAVIVQQPDLAPLPPIDLDAARVRLSQLPTGDDAPIPTPATTLPLGSRMIFDPNPLFTGRANELRALAAALARGDANVISTGIGGVGKTSLAIEVAWRYGTYFLGSVFWVNCAEAANIPSEITACGGAGGMRLAGLASLKLDAQVALVLAEWARDTPRLLIFDNCEDPAVLRAYRPRGGGCRVLATSRNAVWPPTLRAATLALDVLPPEDSVALLRALCARLNDDEALQVAEALGRLPLALQLAGSYLERYGTPMEGYLAALASPALLEHASLTGRGAVDRPTGREMHVAKAFALSFEKLDTTDPIDAAALALLARATWLAPGEPFPQALLEAALPEPEDDDAAALNRSDGLRRLLELGLLERAGADGLKLHRLLVRYAARLVLDDDAQAAVEMALDDLAARLNRAGYPQQLTPIQTQLRYVTDVARDRDDPRAAGLSNNLGVLLHAQGDNAGAWPYLERALAIKEQALRPDHPETATSLDNLGTLLGSMGDYAGARPYLERALAIRAQALGPNHPDTATSLNNLGYLLHAQGDYAGARSHLERALAIWERALGPNHPKTASSLNNLGELLRAQGDLAAARPYYERALAIRAQALGPAHPETAGSLNNLGALLHVQGDYARARPYYERALAIWERALGPDHPDTASSLNNLGTLLQAQGDYARARPYYERALAIRAQALGPAHLETAASLSNLAILCYYENDIGEAARLMRRALAIHEKMLGPAHPDSISSRTSLAVIEERLRKAGKRSWLARLLGR